MPLPLLGLAAGLFGGGGAAAAPSGPVTTTTTNTAAPVSFGAKNLGRGTVTSTDTSATASGGASIQTAAADRTPLYIAAGVGVLIVALVLFKRGNG